MRRPLASLVPAALLVGAVLAGPAPAQQVAVEVLGTVEYNQIAAGELGQAQATDPVRIAFLLDAGDFVDDPTFPTRGYPIVDGTFTFEAGGASLGLQDPFPAGPPAMFVLRNDDPAVDGFFLSTATDAPVPPPLAQTGVFGAFASYFSVTYGDDPLSSLDVVAAAGTYGFTGLTVFGFTVQDGPFDALGVVFTQLTISPAPACGFEQYGSPDPVHTLVLNGVGTPQVAGQFRALVPNAPPSGAFLALSLGAADFPLYGGYALVDPAGLFALKFAPTGPNGAGLALPIPADPAFAGLELYAQAAGLDLGAPQGVALSNGLKTTVCP